MPNPTFKVLARQDVSSVASVSFDNVFNATMKRYKIVVNLLATAGTDIGYRLRSGGVDNSSTIYNQQFTLITGASRSSATDQLSFNLATKGNPSINNITILELLNPFQTEYTTGFSFGCYAFNATDIDSWIAGQGTDVTTSYDGITLRFASATFTGSVTIYGWVF